jgi:hypothetical protein
MALELADDRRHGEAREGVAAARLEAVDRLDERQRRDLDEVVERLARVLVAPCERAREGQEALDERAARVRVAPLGDLLEEGPLAQRAAVGAAAPERGSHPSVRQGCEVVTHGCERRSRGAQHQMTGPRSSGPRSLVHQ